MAAVNPLDDILNSSVDELAINALVGNLEARLASPSNKDVSNSLSDASVNNNHIGTTRSSTPQNSGSVFNTATGVGANGQAVSAHKNFTNSHNLNVQSPSSKTDSQLIGINSILNPMNSSQTSNIVSTHVNSLTVNRSSPIPESNRIQSPHIIRTVSNSPGFQNARNSPVPSPNSNPAISASSQHAIKPDNSAIIQNVAILGDHKPLMSQGNCIQVSSSQQIPGGQNVCVKQEPAISSQYIVKTENMPVSSVKNEPRTAAIQAVTGLQNSVYTSGNHITHATNVHIVNAPIKGHSGVITVKTGPQHVVMRPQIVQNSGQMQVVNVSAHSNRPPGIVQVPHGKHQPVRIATPARHSQINIAPRPGGAPNTITLPPGVQIPPGTVLMRNEQGQLMFVPALHASQQPTTQGQRIQYVRPPVSSHQQRPPNSQIVTIQPQQAQPPRVVRPNTQPSVTSSVPTVVSQPPSASQGSLPGHHQQPLDNVKKCKNFLSTLIKLAASQPEQTVKNVRELIQGLIDNKVEPEQFTERLQKELKSSPQPYLVPFLKKSLPHLRQSLLENKMHIEGVKAPPIEVMKGTAFGSSNIQPHPSHIRLQQQPMDGLQHIRPNQVRMQQRPVIPKTVMTAGHPVASPSASRPHSAKPKYESLKDDDDINDVATMGGVNLTEESRNILASNSEFIGTHIRSCSDEAFLHHSALQKRVSCIARKHGLDVTNDVLNLVSHATQERLRDLVEKLATIAEHRIEIYKMNEKFEPSSDVKSQLKFIEELDKIEKKRHEEQEWEKIMKAAKSRSKNEDPEQQKIKQKARELQQAENDRMRQKEANLTALAAIGPRKKRKTDAMEAQSAAGSMNLHNGPQSSSSRQTLSRPRIKRVTLRDLLFLMEEERTLGRSDILYKTFLK
ncbi:transcription initiation factor TFIID subunit 4-like isoform X1 [Mytilus edulis]|uniref:transcription initiation factor TFIID subunit 4-like isoform X1 n=1 Tax=Mytilus edulis TaxID=6550 RepID=UPI0039EF5CCF